MKRSAIHAIVPEGRVPWTFRGRGRRGYRAFTLMEVMVASTMTAVLLVCVMTGVVTLQHGYASTEEYAAGQADQSRLLDLLAQDFRRGIQVNDNTTCYTLDADKQGLKITVPDLYAFGASDLQHLFPIMVDPVYDATTQTAYYNGSGAKVAAGGPYPYQTIAYRFNPADGSITRSDPWAPMLTGSKGGYRAAPMIVASNMEAFPTITPDPADLNGNTVHYGVSFHATFRAGTNTTNGTDISLHNVTFIRSKNLTH